MLLRTSAVTLGMALTFSPAARADPVNVVLTRDLPRDHVDLRRAMLLDTLDAAARVSRADLFVAFEPAGAAVEFQSLTGGSPRLILQRGGTLGDRMRNVFADLFAGGHAQGREEIVLAGVAGAAVVRRRRARRSPTGCE